ncbi:MAG: glycosyltransferase [Pseudomonadota bacterium]
MKIIILGNKTDVLDEGAKNVATNLSKSFEKTSEVLTIHQRKAWHINNLLKAISFKPDIVMSIHGPSIKTIILLFIYKIICRCKSVIVAAQPHNKSSMLSIASFLPVDFVFAQSKNWYDKFTKHKINTILLPNGVDTEKFTPNQNKAELLETYLKLGLSDTDKILLHIGPVNYNRNHELLMKVASNTDWKVVIIGSTTAPFSQELFDKIKDSGVIAFNEYFPYINQLYSVANYYIFPVTDENGSIEFPLTVLEAMACNCPVISTRFKGIPDFIEETSSFRYITEYDDLLEILNNNNPTDDNRSTSLSYSWKNIANTITQEIK